LRALQIHETGEIGLWIPNYQISEVLVSRGGGGVGGCQVITCSEYSKEKGGAVIPFFINDFADAAMPFIL